MAKQPVMTVNLASETLEWLDALAENGLLVTTKGKAAPHPQVAKLVQALHVVLAGGKVDLKVAKRGDPKLKKALDQKLEKALKASAKLTGDMRVLMP